MRRFEEAGGSAPDEADSGVRDAMRENVMGAGQSRRIWAELYKVVDSSDVVIQVHTHISSSYTLTFRPSSSAW